MSATSEREAALSSNTRRGPVRGARAAPSCDDEKCDRPRSPLPRSCFKQRAARCKWRRSLRQGRDARAVRRSPPPAHSSQTCSQARRGAGVARLSARRRSLRRREEARAFFLLVSFINPPTAHNSALGACDTHGGATQHTRASRGFAFLGQPRKWGGPPPRQWRLFPWGSSW